MVMEMAREDSQEQCWLDASIQEREVAVQSILCLQCDLGTSWMHGHDHECPKFKEKKTTRGEDEIQSIFCLLCALGSGSWTEGHDDGCPKFNEKRATTKKTGAPTIKKTGASPKKTERRKSRENKNKRQVNGKCETKSSISAHDKQKYSYATSTKTPSVVFTMTTVSKMNLMGAVTTTNTGVYHHPTQSILAPPLDQYAVNSPRLAPLHPSFYCSPLYMIPSNCCFGLPPFYCGKKLEYCNRKRRGRPPNCNFNCPARQR